MMMSDPAPRQPQSHLPQEDALAFEVVALRNRMLAEWATAILQLPTAEAADYSGSMIELGFEHAGEEAIVDKLLADFRAAGLDASAEEVSEHMRRLLVIAEDRAFAPSWSRAEAA